MDIARKLARRKLIVGFWAMAATLMMLTGALAWYHPERGTAERADILDAIRPAIVAQMRGPVEFVVREMRVQDGWAFVVVDPQRPGGGAIDPYETSFADDADFLDGLTVYALTQNTNGRWNLIDHVVGPTDVAYEPWPQFYGAPKEIFGF